MLSLVRPFFTTVTEKKKVTEERGEKGKRR